MALISIVVPVYYNAPSLRALVERLSALDEDVPEHAFEFIFVDDGSGDNSFAILQEIAAADNRVRVVRLARNFGSNLAILAGMTYAKGDCVGFIAADLQDPPEALSEMIDLWDQGTPVVLAVRKDRNADPIATRIPAQFFNWLLEKFVFSGYSPQGVGFLIMDRLVANVIGRAAERNSHLIGLVIWSGYEYKLVEYDRALRQHGKSRWTFSRKIKYLIDTFVAFSYLPLRFASALGIILSFLGLTYALIIIALRLLNQVEVPGWSALTVIVLLTSGAQLLILGVMGEYLWRVLDETRRRPLYTVRSLTNIDHFLALGETADREDLLAIKDRSSYQRKAVDSNEKISESAGN